MSLAEFNSGSYCLFGADSIIAWYESLIKNGVLLSDQFQENGIQVLQKFADQLIAKENESSVKWTQKITKIFQNHHEEEINLSGIYLYGGVGRGKSFLMDGFYLQLPIEKKIRVHFHQFMQHLHADMKINENQPDPLKKVAMEMAAQFNFICFDEFHISDITDAMIIGRLLDILLSENVHFVMTSNYPPSNLYPNGLGRDRFLPTIALLEKKFQIVEIGGGEDYRQRILSHHPSYFSPWNEKNKKSMQNLFEGLSGGIRIKKIINLKGRKLQAIERSSDCIWFDFDTLCKSARSKEDYLHIANRYATVFLSNVPQLNSPDLVEAARRFTWLVDILYDSRVALVIGAQASLEELYGNDEGGESGRTVSRLHEMQSQLLLSSP